MKCTCHQLKIHFPVVQAQNIPNLYEIEFKINRNSRRLKEGKNKVIYEVTMRDLRFRASRELQASTGCICLDHRSEELHSLLISSMIKASTFLKINNVK